MKKNCGGFSKTVYNTGQGGGKIQERADEGQTLHDITGQGIMKENGTHFPAVKQKKAEKQNAQEQAVFDGSLNGIGYLAVVP